MQSSFTAIATTMKPLSPALRLAAACLSLLMHAGMPGLLQAAPPVPPDRGGVVDGEIAVCDPYPRRAC
jgi:hypothetical protein